MESVAAREKLKEQKPNCPPPPQSPKPQGKNKGLNRSYSPDIF